MTTRTTPRRPTSTWPSATRSTTTRTTPRTPTWTSATRSTTTRRPTTSTTPSTRTTRPRRTWTPTSRSGTRSTTTRTTPRRSRTRSTTTRTTPRTPTSTPTWTWTWTSRSTRSGTAPTSADLLDHRVPVASRGATGTRLSASVPAGPPGGRTGAVRRCVPVATSAQLLDRAGALAEVCGRPDLQRRLLQARARSADPRVRVLVVGEPKQGKSSLVNGLVGAPVCPVADDVATVVPTVVRAGEVPRASLVLATGPQPDDGPTERVPVPVDQVAARVTGEGTDRLVQAEVELPRRLLDGLELVDTAGVGGVGAQRALRTVDLLPTADAVLLVSDASQEFTAPEMAFLEQAVALCPTVVCVLTKTDACPHWREVAEL